MPIGEHRGATGCVVGLLDTEMLKHNNIPPPPPPPFLPFRPPSRKGSKPTPSPAPTGGGGETLSGAQTPPPPRGPENVQR